MKYFKAHICAKNYLIEQRLKNKKIEIFLKDSAVKPKKLNISDTFQKQIKKQLGIVLFFLYPYPFLYTEKSELTLFLPLPKLS